MNFKTDSLGQPKKLEPNKPKLAPGQHPEDVMPKKKRRRKNKEPEDLGAS